MTIQSIEQVLDNAIALLMYGSGAWLSYSLVTFVVTRSKASVNQDLLATQKNKPRLALPQATSPLLTEIMLEETAIEKTLLDAPILEETVSEGSISIEVISEVVTNSTTIEASVESETVEPSQAITPPITAPIAIELPLLPQAPVVPPIQAEPPLIICEPVNWKKRKVAELRKSNITKVCGVRTSPIGSSRKLKKADLIAQYEQNLRRMTYERPAQTTRQEKIA